VPLILLFVILLLIFASVLIVPISIVQRYRVGVARRPARGWLVALNLAGFTLSAMLFVIGAAMSNFWVPNALAASVTGLVAGIALGALGLILTRWEHVRGQLYFTPNRWLVLAITLVVAVRLCYGLWRSWHSWQVGMAGGSWFVAAGVDGSLAAGALVLGYYVMYWAGVRRRLRHARR
jgi:hypothetical protein